MRADFRRAAAIVIAFWAVTAIRCVGPVSTGGTGSKVVIGIVTNEDGTPAGRTEVLLHPHGIDPVTANFSDVTGVDTTDSAGRYKITFQPVAGDTYTLQAVNLESLSRCIVPEIPLAPAGESTLMLPFCSRPAASGCFSSIRVYRQTDMSISRGLPSMDLSPKGRE